MMSERSCKECGNQKENAFCNTCKKDTYSFITEDLKENLSMGDDLHAEVTRGDMAMTYFTVVFSVLVTIILGLLALIPETVLYWYWKMLISIALIVLAYFCLLSDRFRGFVVWVFEKIKQHKEIR